MATNVTIAVPITPVKGYFPPDINIGQLLEKYAPGVKNPSQDCIAWVLEMEKLDAAIELRTQLCPTQTGPYVSTSEILYRNSHNTYERDFDGISIAEQWERLMNGDMSMDQGVWYKAIWHLLKLIVFYSDDSDQVFEICCMSKLAHMSPTRRFFQEDIYKAINTRNKRYQGECSKAHSKVDTSKLVGLACDLQWRARTEQESEDLEWERKAIFKEYVSKIRHYWKMISFVELGSLWGVSSTQARNIVMRWFDKKWLRRDESRSYRKGYHWFVSLYHRIPKTKEQTTAGKDYNKEVKAVTIPVYTAPVSVPRGQEVENRLKAYVNRQFREFMEGIEGELDEVDCSYT